MIRILLVDDDAGITDVLSMVLESNDYDVTAETSGETALTLLSSEQGFDLLISDLKMEPVDGMQLLRAAREGRPEMPVLMLTGNATLDSATEALKLGAFDYIIKPFKVDELLLTVEKALEHGSAAVADTGNMPAKPDFYFEEIVAVSESMKEVCEMARKIAPTDTPVMIYGEDGVGKSSIARAIHAASQRSSGPFIALECARLPEQSVEVELFGSQGPAEKKGALENAHGGTLFIEQLEAIPTQTQERLAKAIQSKSIERIGAAGQISIRARIIASMNDAPKDMQTHGTLLNGLMSLLSLITVKILPLRERPEDVLPLIRHILDSIGEEEDISLSVDAEAQRILQSYAWPGNVREMEKALRHSIESADDGNITKDDLPPEIAATVIQVPKKGAKSPVSEFQGKSLKAFIRTQAADGLKIGLSQLKKKVKEN